MNINLNPGGVITAIVALCAAFGISMLSNNPDFHDHMAKLTIFAVVFGAFIGNFAWSLAFGKKREEPRIEVFKNAMTACPLCGTAMQPSETQCSSCGESPKARTTPS